MSENITRIQFLRKCHKSLTEERPHVQSFYKYLVSPFSWWTYTHIFTLLFRFIFYQIFSDDFCLSKREPGCSEFGLTVCKVPDGLLTPTIRCDCAVARNFCATGRYCFPNAMSNLTLLWRTLFSCFTYRYLWQRALWIFLIDLLSLETHFYEARYTRGNFCCDNYSLY